jgi:hypothetical protein
VNKDKEKTDEAACQKWERTLSSHYQDFMLTLNIAGAKNKDYRYRVQRASAIERARSAAEAVLIASRDGLSEDAVGNMAEDLYAALCGITAAGISTERIKDVGIQLLQTIVYERPFPYSASATAAEEFNKAPERVLYRADSFTTTGIQPQEFLLAPIFPLGVAGVLFGPGGVGKSLLALQLCLSVAKRAVTASQTPTSIPDPLGYHVPVESGGASLFITLEDNDIFLIAKSRSAEKSSGCVTPRVDPINAVGK